MQRPEQPGGTISHPIERPGFLAKGRDIHNNSMHTKTLWNALYFSVLLILLFMSESMSGQALKDRVAEAVDSSQLTVVKGNVHPLARPQYDQGRVEPSMPMRVTMVFKMSTEQQADLDALLVSQQERGSPDYQRWLTPEQFGSRFGLSQVDINKVTTWLESEGFQVETLPASENMIAFRGAAQQVEAALHTEVHRYVVNGEAHFSNSSNPSVPAALANVVLSVRGLNNFKLKPRVKRVSPRFTSGQTGNHFITPPDFATIYNLNPLYQQGINGTGQKIVVVGQSDVALSDIQAFRKNSGLSVNNPQPTDPNNAAFVGLIVPGDQDPGMQASDIDEANLDVEWAGAIAPDATVTFIVGNPVTGGGVFDALNYAVTHSPIPAPVISTSYGECEAFAIQDGSFSFLQSLAQQANAEGITILGPGGDSGAADCDGDVAVSTLGLAVDVPASLANVTAVGGTEFTEGADLTGTFWVNPWVGSPPACVATGTCTFSDMVSSARSYIPEEAWNDTSGSLGLTSGGGGSSALVAKPAWQTGTGVPNDAARDVPDVSFSASPVHDPYLICSEYADPTTSQLTPWCTTNGFRNTNSNPNLNGDVDAVGGTSIGPPAMAGIIALISQQTGHTTGWGNINTILYPLAAHVPSAFHDVATGNNQVPFSSACGTETQIGYNATTGYDLATGIGSINALTLVTNWTSVSPTSAGIASTSADFSLSFSPSSLIVKRGTCGTGSVRVTLLNGFAGTPTFTCSASVAIGGGLTVPTACTVTPAITTSLNPPRDYRELGWWGTVGVLLAGIAMVLVVTFRRPETTNVESRAWPKLVPAFALMTLLAIAIGCGSSSSSGSSNTTNPSIVSYTLSVSVPSNAPVATGSVTVNGASGMLSHTAGITVTTQ